MPKLIDIVRKELRTENYSIRTEKTYLNWIKHFIFFHNKHHPKEMGADKIKASINNLAESHHVSAATQNLALNSILYLYREIFKKEIGWINEIKFAHKKKHLPPVLTKKETNSIFINLEGIASLVPKIIYRSGLRLTECLRLIDLDFENKIIPVWNGKGEKGRVTNGACRKSDQRVGETTNKKLK